MTAKEIYQEQTGNKSPDNQIAFHEWYQEYVKWLEREVVEYYRK